MSARILLHLAPFSVVWLVCAPLGCTSRGTEPVFSGSAEQTVLPPELEHAWYLKTIPAPGSRAVSVAPRFPLRNGAAVSKKRWIEVPAGQSIRLESGTGVVVPKGTRLWKDFYFKVGGKNELIERRLITKTGNGNGFESWTFQTARRRIKGEDAVAGRVVTDAKSMSLFALDPASKSPLNEFPHEAAVRVEGEVVYVYPGTKNCVFCHSGVRRIYPGEPENQPPVFSLQPGLLDDASVARLKAAGFFAPQALEGLMAASPKQVPPTSTRNLLGEFRTNCMTCHSPSSVAFSSLTQFLLDPSRDYSPAELKAALSVPSLNLAPVMERLPGHLRGTLSPMPPESGGIPVHSKEVDAERQALLEVFFKWRKDVP